MYTLYYSPGACSMAVHVALLETGAKHTLERSSDANGKRAEFLAANPRGSVPVLVDDGHVIREGGAILVYLLDKEKGPLLPREGVARASALEWLMFCNATLHPVYGRAFGAMRMADADFKAKTTALCVEQINKYWQDVDSHLAKHRYLAGNAVTIGDILMTVIANWSPNFQGITWGENVARVLREVSSLPTYRQALANENVEYKVAA